VNEFVSADHDSNMCRQLPCAVVDRVEEDEIAGAEIPRVDFIAGAKLFRYRARQIDAMLTEDVPHEAAAVETRGITAAISVWRTAQG
jgi:hypothetical protein